MTKISKYVFIIISMMFHPFVNAGSTIWFDCEFTNYQDETIVLYTSDPDSSGQVEVIIQNQKNETIYAKEKIFSVSSSDIDDISIIVLGAKFGKIVLTKDYESLVVNGLLTLRTEGINSPAFHSLRMTMNDERSVNLTCAIE